MKYSYVENEKATKEKVNLLGVAYIAFFVSLLDYKQICTELALSIPFFVLLAALIAMLLDLQEARRADSRPFLPIWFNQAVCALTLAGCGAVYLKLFLDFLLG